MTRKEHRAYERRIVAGLRAMGGRRPPGWYDEQGLPAYTNPNVLMRHVFWKRTWVMARMLDRMPPADLAVDFGSGLGIMLPILAGRAREIVAVEIEPGKLLEAAEDLKIPLSHVRVVGSMGEAIGPDGPLADLVLAMDVLEHVDDLPETILEIFRSLKPGGRLVVSGPTENAFYRLGRRLAGYSGHYHHRSIGDVEKAMSGRFRIAAKKVVFPAVPLFVMLEAIR
jgi:2-polyprenyl-3-methyl-5-hydroxy-6-metoxy-1,4-benzoquinol methylase